MDRVQESNDAECHVTASQPTKWHCVTDGNK